MGLPRSVELREIVGPTMVTSMGAEGKAAVALLPATKRRMAVGLGRNKAN
jgi:hypothetical protein